MKLARAFLLAANLVGQTLPNFSGENLPGKTVELPAAAAGHSAVLLIGFTHASQSQTKAWSQRLAHEPNPGYSIAVLQDVPRLVRGMAVHGIKSGVPADQRDRFLLVYKNGAELKRVVEFSAPDDAYVLALGAIATSAGTFTDPSPRLL